MNAESAQIYSTARLRQSFVVFLASKGLTAPLNLIAFFLIAARLPRPDFALYAWVTAFAQVAHQLSFLGINWIALHYVPYYRSRVGGRPYRLFLLTLVALRLALVAALAAATYAGAPRLVAAVGHEAWLPALRLYLAVLAAELQVEFLRSCIFEPLLEQGVSQGTVLLQHTVFLAGLLILLSSASVPLSIEHVIVARAVAVWVALAAALVQFARELRKPAAAAGDQPLGARFLLRFALDNYVQDVMRLTSGGSLMTMVASRLVGVADLAIFGFAQNLTGFLHRFLPAQLFLGLLRPRVIAAYGSDRSFGELRRRIALILKISSCVFAAAVAVLVAVGRQALGLLSGGQYASSYGLLLVFLLWLAIVSLQRMQSVLANVLGRSELLRRASFSSLLVVPAAVALVHLGAGPYGLVLGMILGESVSAWLISNRLRRAGYRFRLDVRGYGRIGAAALAATITGALCAFRLPGGRWSVAAGAAATLATFTLAVLLLRPFPPEERRAIESLLGRRLDLL